MNPRPSEYMTYFGILNFPKAALMRHLVRPEIEGGDACSIVVSNESDCSVEVYQRIMTENCPLQVQIGRLGRSKSLSMSAYEVTSTSCVAQTAMPLDASRW